MKNLEKNSKHTLVEKNRDSPSIEKLERMKRVVVTVAKHSTFMKKNGDTSYRVGRYENLSAATVIHHYNNTFTNAQSPRVTHNLQCRENI